MGTHGLFGFVYKGRIYLIYNHYDSYLDGLGFSLICEIKFAVKNNLIDEWIKKLESCRIVREDDDIQPTPDEAKELKEWTGYSTHGSVTKEDGTVSFEGYNEEDTWYWCLNKCQGSFIRVLNSGYLLTVIKVEDETKINRTIKKAITKMENYVYILNIDKMRYTVLYSSDEDGNEEGGGSSYVQEHYDINNLPDMFAGKKIGTLKYPGRILTYRIDDNNVLIYDD
jgi:hypothetical protein